VHRDHVRNRDLHPAAPDRDRVRYHLFQLHRKTKKTKKNRLLIVVFRGRAARLRDWDGEAGYRLHVSPLNPRTKRKDIEKIFLKFGTINEVGRLKFVFFFCFIEIDLGLDGDKSAVFRICQLQASRRCRRGDPCHGRKVCEFKNKNKSFTICFRSIDGSRVGISYARKRTIGGRRGGGGGDRYSRDRDSSRYRRRYSPRPSDDRWVFNSRFVCFCEKIGIFLVMIVDDVTHDRVHEVQFNVANAIIVNVRDQLRQGEFIRKI